MKGLSKGFTEGVKNLNRVYIGKATDDLMFEGYLRVVGRDFAETLTLQGEKYIQVQTNCCILQTEYDKLFDL